MSHTPDNPLQVLTGDNTEGNPYAKLSTIPEADQKEAFLGILTKGLLERNALALTHIVLSSSDLVAGQRLVSHTGTDPEINEQNRQAYTSMMSEFDVVFSMNAIQALIKVADMDDINERTLVRAAVTRFVYDQSLVYTKQVEMELAQDDIFSSRLEAVLPQEGKKIDIHAILEQYASTDEGNANPTLYDKYGYMRLCIGNNKPRGENIREQIQLAEAFDEMKYHKEVRDFLFQTKLMRDLGGVDHQGIPSSITMQELQLPGLGIEKARELSEQVVASLKSTFIPFQSDNYTLMKNAWIGASSDSPLPDIMGTIATILNENFNVSPAEWQAAHLVLTQNLDPTLKMASHNSSHHGDVLDTYKKHFPQVTRHPYWEEFKTKVSFIVSPETNSLGAQRTATHESGHALHEMLIRELLKADPMRPFILGQPSLSYEIMSSFLELHLGLEDTVSRFAQLIALRSSASTILEIDLRSKADELLNATDGNITDGIVTVMATFQREKAKEVFRNAFDLEATSIEDFAGVSYCKPFSDNFLFVCGTILAPALKSLVEGSADSPHAKREKIQGILASIYETDDFNDLLNIMETTWPEALDTFLALHKGRMKNQTQ